MQLKQATKLLIRIWKAVVWAELAVLAGVLVFMFSQFFSYRVFISKFHHQAGAATSRMAR